MNAILSLLRYVLLYLWMSFTGKMVIVFLQQKRQESQYNNHPNHYNSNSNHRNSIGHSSHHHLTSNHGANSHHAQQQYNFGAHHPNQAAHTYNGNISPHHQQSHNNGTSHHHYRTSRPSLSSYNSSFNGRTNAPPIQLHRSQVTTNHASTWSLYKNNKPVIAVQDELMSFSLAESNNFWNILFCPLLIKPLQQFCSKGSWIAHNWNKIW